MKFVFIRLFVIALAISLFSQKSVMASGDVIVLKAQDEYSVNQGQDLHISQKKQIISDGNSDEAGCGTPDIGLNGSITVGKIKKITISGKFDLTFNEIRGVDISIKNGSNLIVYDCLEQLKLQKE